ELGNSSISDKHVFFVALHFTTREPISDKYLIQKLIREAYESNKWKEFANDELAKNPRLIINYYDREINNLEFSVRQLSDDELDDLTK
ncbi:hypothetical protein, partial [Streptococcus suis]|uniref:hypothetical protein n=1 Tax=Streptococcus suis TaxID=1307 RepID=UPI0005162E92